MQLICDSVTGSNVGMGETVFTPIPGRDIFTVNFEIPNENMEFYTFNGSVLVRKDQSVIDQINAYNNFSVDVLAAGLSQVFDIESQISLRASFGILQGYAKAKVFTGEKSVKSFMAALVSGTPQRMTPEQYETIRAVILTQGIDIGALV